MRQPSNDARHWPQRVAIAGLSQKDSQHLLSLPETSRHFYTRVTVGADSVPIRCIIVKSSGNAEIDVALCAMLMRSRYAAATDVFGDPMVSDLSVPITFD